jgi:type I site-specific restriction endonuclease
MISENKKNLSERDICTKFITPAVRKAGWDVLSQIREEVSFTCTRISTGDRSGLQSVNLRSKGCRD